MTKQVKSKKVGNLVIIRHGESEYNAQGLWAGWINPKLTSKGKDEAKLAAESLKDLNFHAAFTSDLDRALETLNIILHHLNKTEIPQHVSSNLRERHYGEYSGKNKWEVKKIVGDEKFKRIRRGWDEPIPQGESLKNVQERVLAHFLAYIKPRLDKGENVLLVASGNSNRALIKYIEKIPDENIADFELATGEVFVYQINKTGKVLKKEKRVINTNKGLQ